MRLPSENLRNKVSTFHSKSEGAFFCGLLKKTSYSIFSRRKCDSSRLNSSSTVMRSPGLPPQRSGNAHAKWVHTVSASLGQICTPHEVSAGHRRHRTYVSGLFLMAEG